MTNLPSPANLPAPTPQIAKSPLQLELSAHRQAIASSPNRVFIDGDRVLIGLTRGLVAVCDARHFEAVQAHKWRAISCGSKVYAGRTVRCGDQRTALLLHRFLLGSEADGLLVDHRDGDGMNNTDDNLRACSHAQNMWNQPAFKSSKTGIKGVRASKDGKAFVVRLMVNGVSHHGGTFKTIAEAKAAHEALATKLQGEFAYNG